MKIDLNILNTKEKFLSFMKDNLENDTNVLLKASRFMKFEEIIEELSK